MPFHVYEQGNAEHKVILLKDTISGTKAEVYAFGALLNVFSIKHKNGERNVIEGFKNTEDAIKNITPGFQSAKLSPFVCRMKEGQYTFANTKYKADKYYYYREALHGLIYDAVFSVAESRADDESAFITLAYDYNKNDLGFPFFYRIQVTYRLQQGNELTIITKVTNLSSESIPMADGWHPYFSFGKKVDSLELFINTNEMIEFNDRLLPTGKTLPFHKFSQPQKINDTQLDNSFVLQQNDSVAACMIRDTEDHLQLSVYTDASYPYLQVFIPNHRNSIAIENLSSLPDAFNNGIGLTILEPSESRTFITKFVIKTIPVVS